MKSVYLILIAKVAVWVSLLVEETLGCLQYYDTAWNLSVIPLCELIALDYIRYEFLTYLSVCVSTEYWKGDFMVLNQQWHER